MKQIRIYVASIWRNEFQPDVVKDLRADGHLVYDFKGDGDGWGFGGSGPGGFGWSEVDGGWQTWNARRYIEALMHPRAVEGYYRDMDALRMSDFCLMVMPCGPSAALELGFACGRNLATCVYIPAMREPDLMIKMAELITDDFEQVRCAALELSCRTALTQRRKGYAAKF
jgi:hypothetical protein